MDKTEGQNMICKCQNCPGELRFDEADAGQTVTCPHCQMDTVLFVPVAAVVFPPPEAKPPSTIIQDKPRAQRRSYFVENDLESIGTTCFVLGLILAAVGLLYMAVAAYMGDGFPPLWPIPTMLILVTLGWLIRVIFRAFAEAIRQLRRMNSAKS